MILLINYSCEDSMGTLKDDHAVDGLHHRVFFLQELVLQEEGIERVDSTLGTLCQHLKILYMPNNLIARLGKTSLLTTISMCLFGDLKHAISAS